MDLHPISREATLEDLDQIYAIETMSFTSPWSERSLSLEISSDITYYEVLLLSDIVVGYMGGYLLLDEAQISNVAIDMDYRKMGLGTAMLSHYLHALEERGITRVTLEVREDNIPAIALYESFGFEKQAVRANYYSDVGKDAYIYWKVWR